MSNTTKEVTNSLGLWKIKKPKAGVRNKALIESEIENGRYKLSVLVTNLLPLCITERPKEVDQTVPIDQMLEDMDTEDYDVLFEALADLVAGSGLVSEQSAEKKN